MKLSRLSALGCFLGVGMIAEAKVSFNEHILPILAENCFACHGPDSSTRKAKLRLDRAEFATAKRDDLPAITPGHPEQSALVERITSQDPEERMPPAESHKTLQPAEIALLKRWIAEGAEYQPHWSLIAPVRPAVPVFSGSVIGSQSVSNRSARAKNSLITAPPITDYSRLNPIDAFILARLQDENLTPARSEDPARLLRRVTLDLTGLPPTPEEIAAFLRDPSPAAYDRAVDLLLASDACAEHFTRQWLDAVRYADTHGIHIDNYRTIWPYRDWVIRAFRQNMPFDQFTIEQMAGDLLPGATLDQKVASGFNRCLPTTSEGGAIVAEYEAIYAKDRVETMSTVWLGLTTGCAACHDHKFDPVTQRDFYSLAAFFRNNTMRAMDGNRFDPPPTLFVPALADRERWTGLQSEITKARAALKTRANKADTDFEQWLTTAKTLVPTPADRMVRLHVPLNDEVGPKSSESSSSPPSSESLASSTSSTSSESSESSQVLPGIYGPAPRINDLDRVLGPAVPFLREGAASIGLLVRIDGKPTGTLLACLDEGGKKGGWEIFLEQGKIGFLITDGKGGVDVRGVAGTALAPARWHHVLLSFDAASMRSRSIEIFVDGKAAANSTVTAHLPGDITPTAPMRLGSRHSATGQAAAFLTGGDVWVQDVRHYQRGFVAADAATLAEVIDTHAALAVAPDTRSAAQKKLLRSHYLAAVDDVSVALAASLDRLLADDDAMRNRGGLTLVMEENKDSAPFAHVLIRGEYSQPGEKVDATTPGVLPPLPADAPRNRLTLARWLVAPENPLTARVTVNRAWQHFFGTGLVESAGDFGVTGALPSHPHLLDWLAVEFRESGWDYRKLVRLMVTSATYRQSAAIPPALLERDPANRLLARGPRHRLEAEQLRDQALAASGLLVGKIGGRPVRPYQPEGIWEEVAMKQSTTRYYRQDVDENLYRRSLYTLWKRTAPPPAMDILNAPSREVSCVRRDRTNTPLQALVTLNEPLFVEASRQLAARAWREAPTFDGRLDAISLRLMGRKFIKAERSVLRRTLDDALATYRRDPAGAKALLAVGASKVDDALPAPEVAAWTLVASQVMNLDESLTK